VIGRPARASWTHELLDEPGHDPAQLRDSFDHIARFNRRLGGSRSLWHTLQPMLARDRMNTLLDVGSGSGRLALELNERARRTRIALSIVALDRVYESVALARSHNGSTPIRLAGGDALGLPFRDGSFDVALLSLTLHHMPDHRQIDALRELARVARIVVVTELERSWLNYVGARLLAATFWRTNRFCRHDGPVSVLRGYTQAELRGLAAGAGLHASDVRRRFFQRLVLVAHSHE
jgi:SAM-dependent methyltransferase